MKNAFTTLLLFATSGSLFANVSTRTFTQHRIATDAPSTIKVRFVKDVMTDECNHYGISGDLRKVKLPKGAYSIISDYVADLGVFSTQVGCPNNHLVLKTITSDWREVKNEYMVTILAPADFKLEIQKPL